MATTDAIRSPDETLDDPFLDGFENEPYIDFSDPEDRRRMRDALETVRSRLGETYPLVIGGREIHRDETFDSIDPARPDRVVGRIAVAGADDVDRAIDAAWEAFEQWSRTSARERVEICNRAREIARERIFEIAAWMVYEVGKNWVEAYADIAEAIDFYDFYSRQMLRLDAPQPLVDRPGEELELRYIPLGVGAMIPPWNFPYAITSGMTIASIVAGNTTVLKPSSDAPVTGYKFYEIWEEAGLPAGVCNYLPGSGSVVGKGLVEHPKTRFVAFTGSKEVGVYIHEAAGKVRDDQIWLKRSILEMGGKDAIVVCDDADLEDAVEGTAKAAFSYQGQKCSACSRAIVDDAVYDEFLERLKARTAEIAVGPTDDHDHWMGPVINEQAMSDILEYMEIGRQEGRLVIGGGELEDAGPGYFLEPTIFADVDPDARIAQEEIFGPVLSVIRARDYDEALEIANGTEYGLTGSVYSADPAKLDRARDEFHVGNLYLNRPCTGAIVGCHPFGGFNMSGTDSKTGGRDYLLLFTQAKSVGEAVDE